jgi:GDP-mannose transporter
MVSATTYTLVGVVNKFITVLLNVLIWDKHSSPVGLLAVCLCLLAGSFYQQAPKRELVNKDKDAEPLVNKSSDRNSA